MRRTRRSRPKLTSRQRLRNPQPFPPPDPQGWKVYYELDPADLPSIKAIAEAWKHNVRARDASTHGHYSLKTILRDVRPGNYLRIDRRDAVERKEWDEFVRNIADSGVLEPVMIEIDRTGEVRLGEGNQRGDVMVPVRFYFREHEMSPQHAGLTWATFTRTEMSPMPKAVRRQEHRREQLAKQFKFKAERQAHKIASKSEVETPEQRERLEELLKLLL